MAEEKGITILGAYATVTEHDFFIILEANDYGAVMEFSLLLVRNDAKVTNDMETKIIPYCQENNILIIAWRPLAKGELAKPGLRILDELVKKYNRTQSQIAINWLISKKGIVTITKSTKPEHLKENLGAIGWKLQQEDADRLNNEFITSS